MPDSLHIINQEIIACGLCPRLVPYRERIAKEKRRAYLAWDYWGKAVPSFGDPRARLLIIGLAPAAHGGNRTGRVFTGDSSGDLLYSTLHETGFANQSSSTSRDDGMVLRDAWITATVHCAPPDNKPLPEESRRCRPFLERELDAFGVGGVTPQLCVVICLGKIAFDAYLDILRTRGLAAPRASFKFGHGAEIEFPNSTVPLPVVLVSYHPSRQNTQTGKLTREMFLTVFRRARQLLTDARPAAQLSFTGSE
jgi:uracil-DNA glycosylase